jgi:hypothetical protein
VSKDDGRLPAAPGYSAEPEPVPVSALRASIPSADEWHPRDEVFDDSEGLCDECGEPWDQCEHFFPNWVCGMGPDGYCSLAGTEECDWECPRNV